jgi:hypothetical protein
LLGIDAFFQFAFRITVAVGAGSGVGVEPVGRSLADHDRMPVPVFLSVRSWFAEPPKSTVSEIVSGVASAFAESSAKSCVASLPSVTTTWASRLT